MIGKFLFLDIDGVLLTQETLMERGSSGLDPACVYRLGQIVARTGCKIVISSSWRVAFSVEEIQDVLSLHGFPFPDSVIDRTPTWKTVKGNIIGTHPVRAEEIQAWMDEHEVKCDQIVIIDDETDMYHINDRLVCVLQGFYNGGLQDLHVERACSILGE